MHRRQWLKQMFAPAVAPFFPPRQCVALSAGRRSFLDETIVRLEKSKAEWITLLSPEQYAVLFEEQTEPPLWSRLNDEMREGTYVCAACHLPLFTSKAKFESRSGWPSFYEPLKGRVATKRDYSRIEYHCVRCGGHHGHVFDDGPPPTGQRWCNNGVALKFFPSGEPLPPLRT